MLTISNTGFVLSHEPFYLMFFLLMVGHAVGDYGLNSEYISNGKNGMLPGVPIWTCLLPHCLMHGGAVWLVTGSLPLAILEMGCHWMIDTGKRLRKITLVQDQLLHVACKLLWVVVLFWGTE